MSHDDQIALVKRAFDAFTRRDVAALTAVVSPDVEFSAITAQRTRGGRPYVGHDGIREYFADVEAVWRELRPIPQRWRTSDDLVLATGRIYGRDHEGSIVDSPAAWLWRLRGERVVHGCVYDRPSDAEADFEHG